MKRVQVLAPLLVLLSAPIQADVSLFVGSPGAPGDVWILDESRILAPELLPELTGIRLLPIDVVGRTRVDKLRGDVPHLRADMPEGTRVLLPSGRCLYRYRREVEDGAQRFGFFGVEPDGRARPLGELSGTGPAGLEDPLEGRLAVSSDGLGLLLSTTLQAGGDLYEIDLQTGAWTLRTAELEPRAFQPDGVCLTSGFGAALTGSELLRFDRLPAAQASQVRFEGAHPAFLGTELICSADGSTIALRAGDGPTQSYIYVAQATGDALRISDTPQDIVDAGFLPASVTGPRMALSPDGKIAAWIVQQPDSRELFVVNTGADAPLDVQVTRNANFQDTLNDSGVIAFVSAGELLLVAGEGDGGEVPEIEEAEVFCVDFSGALSDPTVANLSRTLTTLTPPFDYGRLTTEDGIFLLESGDVLAHDPGQPDVPGRIVSIGPAGPTVLFPEVEQIEWAESVATHMLAKVQLASAEGGSRLLDIAPSGQVSSVRAPGLEISRHAVHAQSGLLTAVLVDDTGGEYLGRAGVMGQGGALLVPFPVAFGPTLGFTLSGSIVASFTSTGGDYFMIWPDQGPLRLLWPAPLQGHLLPAH